MSFKNRIEAGQHLALLLEKYQNKDLVVYALPRGGVPVAAEIAKALDAPLDLIFAHKIGHPHQPEYAIGAISEAGHLIERSVELLTLDQTWLEHAKEREMHEIKRKRTLYLQGKKAIEAKNKIAIIVDDGIATGLTMQVGIKELRDQHPKKIVAVVPVAPKRAADRLKTMVDDFIALEIPGDDLFLGSVGAYYREFDQVEDEEVIAILKNHLHI